MQTMHQYAKYAPGTLLMTPAAAAAGHASSRPGGLMIIQAVTDSESDSESLRAPGLNASGRGPRPPAGRDLAGAPLPGNRPHSSQVFECDWLRDSIVRSSSFAKFEP